MLTFKPTQARGAMCRYIIVNRVTSPEGLKGFTGKEGEWCFDEKQSKVGQISRHLHRT